ncbi:pentatricopeptide repeat-containing protein At3g12770-like [Phoenix dactylifera]|uniref:Pentatricopeptide repeat-containing protein At3g12770-like n=1 Tax=Phoenix dactylifera TaxID=42345 RepID=A0A8B7CRI5_PHODC|nr:pentatricopeptide repeat-containing protein At3g12770-like [Phoenix dactylifera]
MVMLLPLPTAITPPSLRSSAANAVTLFPGGTRIRHFPRSHSSNAPTSDQMPDRDPPGWAALIRRRARDGRPGEALALFREMVVEHRHKPDDLSITVVLGCCALLGAVGSGKEVHGFMVRDSGDKVRDASSESSLVRFYAKCGLLSRAREVFDRMPERDVVSWTIMLLAYADREECQREMMDLFVEMLCGGVLPNGYTFTVVLSRATLEQGEQLHAHIVKRSWDSDAFVGSSLVDLYAENGNLGGAQLVFDRIEHKDVVCYNSLISGYGRVGFVGGLFSLFEEMLLVGLVPNQSSFVALLSGCTNSGFMSPSKQFHAQVIVRGLESDQMIQGVIVDLYAKCGDLELARVAFDRIGVTKNVVVWNSMIDGYAKHGRTEEALQVFSLMELASVHPDYITFICLLSACSHSGFVDEGWRLFCLMREVYGIPAQNEHYCCMVDLLGRAGMVCEAYEFILRSKCGFLASVWGALLSSCRFLKNARIGEIAARRLFELEPKCSGSYVALASIYSAIGQWGVAAAVRELMDVRGIKKDPGYSWIEVDGVVHKFRAMEGLGGHNFMNEVYIMCNRLNLCIHDHYHLDMLFDFEDYYYSSETKIKMK